MIKKIIGFILLGIPFIAIIAALSYVIGFMPTIAIFGASTATALLCVLGIMLIVGDD